MRVDRVTAAEERERVVRLRKMKHSLVRRMALILGVTSRP